MCLKSILLGTWLSLREAKDLSSPRAALDRGTESVNLSYNPHITARRSDLWWLIKLSILRDPIPVTCTEHVAEHAFVLQNTEMTCVFKNNSLHIVTCPSFRD
jgi:hypothetical protein